MSSKRKIQEIVKEYNEEVIVGEKVIKRSVKYTLKYEGNNDAGNISKDGENVEDAREAKAPKRTKIDGENVGDAREAKIPKTKKEEIVTGFDRGLEPDKIVGDAVSPSGEIWFRIRWKGSHEDENVPLKSIPFIGSSKLIFDYFIKDLKSIKAKRFKD